MRIGIDLGGTKTEILALDEVSGAELYRRRIPTVKTYEGVVRGIRDLVLTAERDLGRTGTVGIGIPGTEAMPTGVAWMSPLAPSIADSIEVALARLPEKLLFSRAARSPARARS